MRSICSTHSKPNNETLRIMAEKEFIHKAARRGNERTSLRSASPKARGVGYLRDKQGGLRHGER